MSDCGAPTPPQSDSAGLPHWFEPGMLNSTFEELQNVVKETSQLASSISTQLESKLQTTEEQLSTLIFVVTEGVVIIDCDCLIQEWNAGAEEIFGYTRAEVIGKHVDMLQIDKDTVEYMVNQFDCACRTPHKRITNTSKTRDMLGRRKDGSDVLTEVSINSFPSTIPGKQNVVAVVRDITAQREEQSRREKERKLLLTVLNSASDVIIVRDAYGRWIKINEAAKNLYGFANDTNWNMNTHMEIAHEFPEFKEHFYESMRTDEEAWQLRRTLRTEAVVVDSCGQRQYFDVMKTPIFDNVGNREMIVITARNITAIKEKREHITIAYKALNASSDIICIVDDHGNILFANKMFIIKYRQLDARSIVGHNINVTHSPRTPDGTYAAMWNTIRTGKMWEGVLINQDAMNNPMTLDTTVIPIVDQQLDTSYYIVVQRSLD